MPPLPGRPGHEAMRPVLAMRRYAHSSAPQRVPAAHCSYAARLEDSSSLLKVTEALS